jgi:hypothetical protein
MHIRQLARNAALITVAVFVTAGFSTGIAQATNAAPASTVSAVTHGGSTTPRMLPGCTPQPLFCTYASSIRGIILIQKFGCASTGHNAAPSPVYQMFNGCGVVVYYYYGTSHGCMRPHSTRAGGFPRNIDYYFVDNQPVCY